MLLAVHIGLECFLAVGAHEGPLLLGKYTQSRLITGLLGRAFEGEFVSLSLAIMEDMLEDIIEGVREFNFSTKLMPS